MSKKNTGRKAKNLKIKERLVRRQAQALVREAEQVVEIPAIDRDRAVKLAYMDGIVAAADIADEARTIGAARKAIAELAESFAASVKEAVGA